MEKVGIPRRTIRLNVALQLLAMAVLLLAANYFSFNHYARADFSRSQKFVLSDQTKRILREIKKPVKVIVYFSPTFITPEAQLFPDVKNLLKEMAFSGRNKFEIEYVDPTRDLTRARELQAQYKFSADENVLILDYEGRVKFLPVPDMAEFDMSPLASGDPPRLMSFKGEQAFANALFALISPEQLKVYFLTGHGEPSVLGDSALSVFKDYVQRQNVAATPLSLASIDAIPADCATLVIAGAQSDLDEREALIVKKYFQNKGRILVLLDPKVKTPRLYDLLQSAGIVALDDRVLRTVRLPFATGILREVTAEFMPENAITKRLVGSNFLLSGATQSLQVVPDKAKELQLWPLVIAGEEFWGETDYVTDGTTGVRYDAGRDFGFPVYVAVASSRGGVSDGRVAVESAKIIAVGNCEFALDAALNQQGIDFLLSSMNWLLNRNQFTGVMPKVVQHFGLNLTERQLSSIAFYTLFIVPGVAALMGIVAWWRRRA